MQRTKANNGEKQDKQFGNVVHKKWEREEKVSNNTFGFKPLDCLLSSVGRIIRKFNQIKKTAECGWVGEGEKKKKETEKVSSLKDPILELSHHYPTRGILFIFVASFVAPQLLKLFR